MVGQTAVALLMTLVVFGITCEGSIGLVIAVTLLQGVAGMCYGIILKVHLRLKLCLKYLKLLNIFHFINRSERGKDFKGIN